MINCVLAGVGGQGTVLASKLIALSAMAKGENARTAETIGMAQRGGSVVSHVRIGKRIHSPLIPLKEADLILGFEPAEAARCLNYLKKDGLMIVSSKAIIPVTASLAGPARKEGAGYDTGKILEYLRNKVPRLVMLDGEAICQLCGSAKTLNVALLGAAVQSGVLGITLKDMETTIAQKLPEKYREMNIKALYAGAELFKDGGIAK